MAITLRSASLEVRVTPERGADIVQIVDLATDTPLLSASPTGLARSVSTPSDSMAAWIQGYPGGWQLLAPNAGPERTHGGYYLSTEGGNTRVRFALECEPRGILARLKSPFRRRMKAEVCQLEQLKSVLEEQAAP